MRNIILLISFITFSSFAQTNTEVYLFDLKTKDDKIRLENKRNISNNEGYDNQPSFLNDTTLLFSSIRKNQTDIAIFDTTRSERHWFNKTKGSEYSPTKVPEDMAVSAIRLDIDGKQRLYKYNLKSGLSKILLDSLKVGYHTWFNEYIIVSSVLEDEYMSLVVSNIKDSTNYTFQKKVGRSLHKIPNSKLISYISKENDIWEIKSLDPISGTTKKIINTITGAEDMCWLINGTILMGKGNQIFKFNPKTDTNWSIFHSFEDTELGDITRMSVNGAGSLLAIVSEVSPKHTVKKLLSAYNKRDIDAFLDHCTKDVTLYNYPSYKTSNDLSSFKKFHQDQFDKVKDLNAKVSTQIIHKNYVINLEEITFANQKYQDVKIYKIVSGKVARIIYFDKFKKADTNPVEIVQKQLDAYNSRNIDAFVATYSDDIKIYNFPDQFQYEGTERLKKGYSLFFERTPDLKCEIKNRIVIGNKVIDEESLTINSQNYKALAVYEVENGKIAKVTFIQ